MSTGGQIAGGVVGGVIGAVVGGPTGAIYGAQIGIMAGGLLDPPKGPTVEGPRLGDLTVQTSTYGQFIPRTYGTIGLSGNVFWLENNKLKEVVRKKKSGGKGGGSSSTVKTYTYFATFAVGLCEGPIAGVRRIWVGPDLVYDAGSDDLETVIASNQASSKFAIYIGTDTQQPDTRMQAEIGVENCPAYRGLAYIVVKDLALANYGNSIAGAQLRVETVMSGDNISIILNEGINTEDSFGIKSVFSALPEMYGFNILDMATSISSDGSASYRNRSFSLGSLSPASEPYVITDINSSEFPRALKSTDGNTWVQYVSDDTFVNAVYLRSDSGQLISMPSNSYAQDLIEYASADIAGYSYKYVTFTFSGSADRTKMTDIGWCASYENTPVPINITGFVSVGLSHKASTAGDKPYRWNIYGATPSSAKTFNIDVYDFGSSSVIESFSVSLSDRWNDTVGNQDQISDTCCRFLDGVVYLVAKDRVNPNAYRYAGLNSSGVIFEYEIELPGTIQDLIAVWPNGQDQAIIQTVDRVIQWRRFSEGSTPLSEIIESEMLLSAIISDSDVDISGTSDSVAGFKVTATGSIRNAIEPLRGAWPFDVVQSGYQIRAASRGSASVITIPVGELAIDTQLTESREMDSQLPQNVTVKYIDRSRDYDVNEQRAQRENTEAVNSLVLELPVVLSANQSAQVAEKLIRIYALEKSDFSFTLPPPYRYLEPGDVVTIATDDADYILRLVSVNQTADGRLECAGRPSSATTYTSIAPGDGGQTGGVTIPLAGETVGLIIDCPVIDEGLQDSPGFAIGMNGYTGGWPGGILFRTSDNGQTWDDLQAITGRATAGFASDILSASSGNLIQRGGSLTVALIGGELESVTEVQMLNGSNIAAYGVNGRWEIIRFQNATLNADGTYTLDTFWRGDNGTEWATGLHAVNDYFVLMTDPDLAFVGMPTDSIGQPRDYRSITAGADIDSAASVSFTYDAVNLETLSGVHPAGSRSAGDLTISWQRRTRVGGAWRDYVDASLGEATQAYEVDVMDGSTVKRTISAVTPTVLYTDAMQVADFGSTQSSVTVNIYQLSAVVGRGYKLEATL